MTGEGAHKPALLTVLAQEPKTPPSAGEQRAADDAPRTPPAWIPHNEEISTLLQMIGPGILTGYRSR